MHLCKILLDRSGNIEEHPCHSILPVDIEKSHVQILTCSMLEQGAGYSMVRVIGEENGIEEGKYESETGFCNVTRVSKGHYMVIVVNRKCLLSSLINQSGCFLSSAVPKTDTLIEWSIVGPDKRTVYELFSKMREKGYVFKIQYSSSMAVSTTLTAKQELYFKTAMDMGYYDIPKRITLDKLAKVLKCSKSTLNVVLRTAENNIFNLYLNLSRSSKYTFE